jgi:hypothetical protein
MPGSYESEYVEARRVLLDALEAIAPHVDAVVLVGAQAVYLNVGEADLAVAPYTTDGDLALNPETLDEVPELDGLLLQAGFVQREGEVGRWVGSHDVVIDLMVPTPLGGGGKRAARLGAHGRTTARKCDGLEASLVDNAWTSVAALDPGDGRSVSVRVAGVAALIVAKVHKIVERIDQPNRLSDKDALDLLRLLRGSEPATIARTLVALSNDALAGVSVREALSRLRDQFAAADAPGPVMAARAAEPLEDPATISASLAALVNELLAAIDQVMRGR